MRKTAWSRSARPTTERAATAGPAPNPISARARPFSQLSAPETAATDPRVLQVNRFLPIRLRRFGQPAAVHDRRADRHPRTGRTARPRPRLVRGDASSRDAAAHRPCARLQLGWARGRSCPCAHARWTAPPSPPSLARSSSRLPSPRAWRRCYRRSSRCWSIAPARPMSSSTLLAPRSPLAMPPTQARLVSRSVLLFTTPGTHRRWWWALASLGVVGMAWSRTYLQVHWLTDVIAGALLGSSISLLVFAIAQKHVGAANGAKCRPGRAVDASALRIDPRHHDGDGRVATGRVETP